VYKVDSFVGLVIDEQFHGQECYDRGLLGTLYFYFF
jgi:hypothetical protein